MAKSDKNVDAITTTITWIIECMNVSTQTIDGFQQVVLSAGWRCTGTDGTYTASNYGSASFPQPATGGQFTPFDQLTENQVLGWCFSNGVDQTATEASIRTQLDNLQNPPVVQPQLPWATSTAA